MKPNKYAKRDRAIIKCKYLIFDRKGNTCESLITSFNKRVSIKCCPIEESHATYNRVIKLQGVPTGLGP